MQHNHEPNVVKFDDRDYQVTCVQCGETFEAARSDAAFCSPRCRLANHRAPKKRANQIEYMGQVGRQMRDVATQYSRSKDVYEAMVRLQSDIAKALAQFEE